MNNLADQAPYAEIKEKLKTQMENELTSQRDPRMLGIGDTFDNYPYAEENMRNFYERYMGGEQLEAGWVNKSDFEAHPLE